MKTKAILAVSAILLSACAIDPSRPSGEPIGSVPLLLGGNYGTRALIIEADGDGPYSALADNFQGNGDADITFIDDGIVVTEPDVQLCPFDVFPCAADFGDVSGNCPQSGGCWTVGVFYASQTVKVPAVFSERNQTTGAWTGETYAGGAFSNVPQCSVTPPQGVACYIPSPTGG